MIVIIDNYDSFTYNLVHLIAAHTDKYEVFRNDKISVKIIKEMNPQGILISPGPGRPEDAGITESVISEMGADIPVLGICLGHQAIGRVFGAKIVHAPVLMHGKTSKITHTGRGIFNGISQSFIATRYHSLVIDEDSLPDVLTVTARSEDDVIQGVKHASLRIEGIQFHPESILTTEGPGIIANWVNSVINN